MRYLLILLLLLSAKTALSAPQASLVEPHVPRFNRLMQQNLDTAEVFLDSLANLPAINVGSLDAARLENLRGILDKNRGDLNAAEVHFQTAMPIASAANDTGLLAALNTQLGEVQYHRGKRYAALAFFGEAYNTYKLIPGKTARRNELIALNSMGNVLASVDQHEVSSQLFEDGLQKARAYDFPRLVSVFLVGIANNLTDQGQLRESLPYRYESIANEKKHQLTFDLAFSYYTLGKIYLDLQEIDSAAKYSQQMQSLIEGKGIAPLETRLNTLKGEILFAQGASSEALPYVEQALAQAVSGDNVVSQSRAHEKLAQIYESLNRPAQALHHHKQFHMLQDSLHDLE